MLKNYKQRGEIGIAFELRDGYFKWPGTDSFKATLLYQIIRPLTELRISYRRQMI